MLYHLTNHEMKIYQPLLDPIIVGDFSVVIMKKSLVTLSWQFNAVFWLSASYGYNAWRDPMQPTQILEKLCSEVGVDEPQYGAGVVTVDGLQFQASEVVENEAGQFNQYRDSSRTVPELSMVVQWNFQ